LIKTTSFEVMLLCHQVSTPPPARWLETVKIIKSKFTIAPASECVWRRLQVHEQQSERQRKNVLQKTMTFLFRANELAWKDPECYLKIV